MSIDAAQTALSGLMVAKAGLDTTAQNVANATTEGYTRQRVSANSIAPGAYAGLSAGSGVEVTDIQRFASDFNDRQLWKATSLEANASERLDSYERIEELFGRDGASISSNLDSFFSALSEATTQPESAPLRQQIIEEARALTLQFNNVSSTLSNFQNAIYDQYQDKVANVNSLLSGISDINDKVVITERSGGNSSVLLDQRSRLVEDVAALIDIEVNYSSENRLEIAFARGIPLIVGSSYSSLSANLDPSNADRIQLSVQTSGAQFSVTHEYGGGLGALADFHEDALGDYENIVNAMATTLHDEINGQLALGQDLVGNFGSAVSPLFTISNPADPAGSITVNGAIEPDLLAFSASVDDGDPLTVDQMTPGDSSNLLALNLIKENAFNIAGLGNVTLNEAYESLLSNVGILTRQSQRESDTYSILHAQAQSNRESLSGVNSDEEATKLMEYSQAYQANLKVINIVNELMDDLFNNLR
jgi:flagellar hook-associated protein 1 FlgK